MTKKVRFLKDLQLPPNQGITIINGYIIPILSIFVLITNMFVILVYIRHYNKTQNVVRKVSSILYISIATTNILSSVPVGIGYLYLYALNNVTTFIPYHLCWLLVFLIQYVYFPHMMSVWYVTLLSVQRYMVIRYPFRLSMHWTVRQTITVVILVWVIPVFLLITNTFDTEVSPYDIFANASKNWTNEVTCSMYYAEWMGENAEIVDASILSLRLLVFILIPFIFIAYCDFSLLIFLRKAWKFRNEKLEELTEHEHFSPQHTTQRHSLTGQTRSEARHQTIIIVVLSSIVIFVHIPYAIMLVLFIYATTSKNVDIVKEFNIGLYRCIADLTVHLSHPTLFIFSCLLSKKFRNLLKILLKCKKLKLRHQQSRNIKTVEEEL